MFTFLPRCYLGFALAACALTGSTIRCGLAGEPERKWVQPRDFGLDIPPGVVIPGGDRCVLTTDGDSRQVVGRIWVQVGNRYVVLMPSGELLVRTEDQVIPTDRRFEPLNVDELAKRFADGPFKRFTVKKTRHYVYVYNTSEEFAVVSSRTLETMIPGILKYAKLRKIPAHEPEIPLVAIMFRTREEFNKYQRMPDGVVAYYHVLNNQVVMYEESPLWKVKKDLAVQQSIATIAHEGAHQILHNVGVQQRLSRWPMWWSEGLAEYLSPTSFGRDLRWKGPGVVNDLRMFEIEMYLKGRSPDVPKGQMIEQTVSAARLTSTGYALAWSLTHFLARHEPDAFDAFARETSRLGPMDGSSEVVPPGIVPSQLRQFQQQCGDNLARIEERLIKHLRSLPYVDPFLEWPHFVATVEYTDGRRQRREVNVFHTRELADKWLREFLGNLLANVRLTAKTEVTEFLNRRTAEQFAWRFLGAAPK